jgi:hypothetical protein
MPSASQLIPSPRALLAQSLAFAANRAQSWATGDRDFLGKIARMFVAHFNSQGAALRQLDADWPPSSQSSAESIHRNADTFGLPNGAGGYGLAVAKPATGGIGVIQGVAGTPITLPQLLQFGAVQLQIRPGSGPYVVSGVPPATGQVSVTIDAVTTGAIGNISAGQTLTLVTPPPGIQPEVVLIAPLANGTDEESPDDARLRLTNRLRYPPKGGAPQDYSAWGSEVTDANGVAYSNLRYYGYSGGDANLGGGGGYDGLAAVMGVQTLKGSGLGRMPTVTLLTDATRYIRGLTTVEGRSPITASVRTLAPFMDPNVTGLVIKLRVVPSKVLYSFDWQRGATVYRVDLNGFNGTNTLRLTGLASAELKQKIDNGQKPRIYIDTRDAAQLPTGPVIPPMVRCVGWSDFAGKTTLTLETPLPPGWTAPLAANNDEVYAGQELICSSSSGSVSGNILTYVDNLGPSKVSGLQDPNDNWDDTCAVSGGIDTAAKNALGPDGLTPLIERCLPGTVQIGVGAGALAAQDVRAPDNSTYGPGLLYALRILTTD